MKGSQVSLEAVGLWDKMQTSTCTPKKRRQVTSFDLFLSKVPVRALGFVMVSMGGSDPTSLLTREAKPSQQNRALLYQVLCVITGDPSAVVFTVKWCHCSSKPCLDCLLAPCTTQMRKSCLFLTHFYMCSSGDLSQHWMSQIKHAL